MLTSFKGWFWLLAILAAIGFTVTVTRRPEPAPRAEPVHSSPAAPISPTRLVPSRFGQAAQVRRFLPQTNSNQRPADRIGQVRSTAAVNEVEIGWRFAPYVAYPISEWQVNTVAIGDVSGDGRNDVVMTVTGNASPNPPNYVLVYRQDTNGDLLAPDKYDFLAKASTSGLALADLNADDVLDIVVGHESGITALVHTAGGFVARRHPGTSWDYTALAVMDLNLDARPDIVAQTWGVYGGDIYYGDGQGGFLAPQHFPFPSSGFGSLEVGDVTSDGLPDLVVAKLPGAAFWVYPPIGADGFNSTVSYYTSQGRRAFDSAIGDFNSDGRNDVAVSLYAHGQQGVEIFLQGGNQQLSFAATLPVYVIPQSIAAADLDGDGRTDLVTMDSWEKLGYYLQGPNGMGALNLENAPFVGASHFQSDGMAIGDTNSDGCLDVAVANYNAGLVIHRGTNCKIRVPPAAITCRLEEQARPVAFSQALAPTPRSERMISRRAAEH